MSFWNASNQVVEQALPADARGVLFDYIKHPDFKRLLNQIVSQQAEQGFRTLSVLSKFPGEGRTFFTAVLALGYSLYLGRKVIIIDTVNSTRSDSFFFGRILSDDRVEKAMISGPGVIDLMTMRALTRQIRLLQRSNSNDLNLLSENEILDPATADFKVGQVLALLRTKYDLVLIDTFAFESSSKENIDPLIIAKQTDTSLVVTSQKSLERSAILSLKSELKSASINLLATVHNPLQSV
jgi:Mrp family chromosome partitioning ATPase